MSGQLKEVSRDEIVNVLENLKEDWPSSIHIYYFIYICNKWIDVNESMEKLKVCSYIGENGDKLFLASYFYNVVTEEKNITSQRVMIHPLMSDREKLKSLLLETDAIDWSGNTYIEAVFERDIPLIKEIGKIKNKPFFHDGIFNQVWLPPVKQQNIIFDIPQDMYIEELAEKHIAKVNDTWRYKSPGTYKNVADTVLLYKGVGLFRKEDGKLVAWNTLQHFGGLGMLYTDDDERGKGYGTLITNVLAKHLVDKGIEPYACIRTDNMPSMAVYTKLGFETIDRVTWLLSYNTFDNLHMTES